MGATTTIRVPVDTRDILARLADSQGVSLSKFLAELATREHLHLIYSAERAATAADLNDPAARAEYELWDEAESDVE